MIAGFGILLLFSYIDICTRKVPVKLLIASNVAAFAYHLIIREIDVFVLLGGIGIGIIFLFISRVTGENLGYGDSWGILILGIYLGAWELLEVLFIAFFLLAVFAIILLTVSRMSRRAALPFFPFLTGGYFLVLLESGIRGGIKL